MMPRVLRSSKDSRKDKKGTGPPSSRIVRGRTVPKFFGSSDSESKDLRGPAPK